jgi:hypothetical protein
VASAVVIVFVSTGLMLVVAFEFVDDVGEDYSWYVYG